MLERIPLEKILFLDIETVPQVYQFQDLDEKGQSLFEQKNRFQVGPEKGIDQVYNERGGILANSVKLFVFPLGWFMIAGRAGLSV